MIKRKFALSLTAICAVILILYEIILGDLLFSSIDGEIRGLVDITVTRSIGALVFTVILVYLGYNVLSCAREKFFKGFLFCLPAFAVAINNFPFSCLIKGDAVIDAPAYRVVLLLAECLAVALFEEMAFRGVIFLGFVERLRMNRKGIFLSIILSSAVFAAVHLLNIFTSSPIAVIMQIGYSFLIGGMCSVILLKTQNIWFCVAAHAIFNFGGAIVSTCGYGEIWDTFTVVFTVVLALATFIYMFITFLKFDISSIGEIYE